MKRDRAECACIEPRFIDCGLSPRPGSSAGACLLADDNRFHGPLPLSRVFRGATFVPASALIHASAYQ